MCNKYVRTQSKIQEYAIIIIIQKNKVGSYKEINTKKVNLSVKIKVPSYSSYPSNLIYQELKYIVWCKYLQ